jgi:hypothetical protein
MCPAHGADTDAKIAAILCHTCARRVEKAQMTIRADKIPAFPAAANEFAARSIYAPCYAAKYSLFRLQGIARNSLS